MTTVIAWLALGVSIVSLTWNIFSWIHSGARVSVRSAEEFVFQQPSKRRIVVVATNAGRLATTVHEVGLKLSATSSKSGKLIGPVVIKAGPAERYELPVRLEPGDELLVKFDDPGLADIFDYGIEPSDFVPSVRAGRKWINGRFSVGEQRVDFTNWTP
ncbi:hypothetical protein [Herbihabitans rhizosphaerae]|uniref:hypothetical protein n=1 Tax=Herbihabitans rhizosphaerae TaxID=1872711 RepID=UPI00102C2C75|nr:hypothetical protein [Herbihabitans rhizosphaerae]